MGVLGDEFVSIAKLEPVISLACCGQTKRSLYHPTPNDLMLLNRPYCLTGRDGP